MVRNTDIEAKLNPPRQLNLPPRPVVKRIRVQQDIDSLGEQALRVWVVLDNQTPDDERRWVNLAPIEERIKERLRESGVEQWPFLTFRTEAEMLEVESKG